MRSISVICGCRPIEFSGSSRLRTVVQFGQGSARKACSVPRVAQAQSVREGGITQGLKYREVRFIGKTTNAAEGCRRRLTLRVGEKGTEAYASLDDL